jgi:hypothetical protein
VLYFVHHTVTKRKLSVSLTIFVRFSQAVSEEMIYENYLENPNDARIIVQKLFLQHKHVTRLKKSSEMVQR